MIQRFSINVKMDMLQRDQTPKQSLASQATGLKAQRANVVQVNGTSLKYQCNELYTLEGPDIVMCQSNGKWTEPPSCKVAFCVIDPAQTTMGDIKLSAVEYIKEGLQKYIPCIWIDRTRRVQCIHGRMYSSACCTSYDHRYGYDSNGNYDASTDGWYGERDRIWVRCDEGYEHKDRGATAQCINGAWSSVPICEILESTESCGDPPKIPHAVIIGKGYQENCSVSVKMDIVQREQTPKQSFASQETGLKAQRAVIDNCGTPPVVANGDVVKSNARYLQYQCAAHYERVGPKMVGCYSDGTWSEAPTCNATYCSVDTDELSHVKSVEVRFIYDGTKAHWECSRSGIFFVQARCIRGKVKLSE
ncbi:hypothetical protein F7725_004848, partial [Dissostichus mawsoni]